MEKPTAVERLWAWCATKGYMPNDPRFCDPEPDNPYPGTETGPDGLTIPTVTHFVYGGTGHIH